MICSSDGKARFIRKEMSYCRLRSISKAKEPQVIIISAANAAYSKRCFPSNGVGEVPESPTRADMRRWPWGESGGWRREILFQICSIPQKIPKINKNYICGDNPKKRQEVVL
jgi:hypothetical protein